MSNFLRWLLGKESDDLKREHAEFERLYADHDRASKRQDRLVKVMQGQIESETRRIEQLIREGSR